MKIKKSHFLVIGFVLVVLLMAATGGKTGLQNVPKKIQSRSVLLP